MIDYIDKDYETALAQDKVLEASAKKKASMMKRASTIFNNKWLSKLS